MIKRMYYERYREELNVPADFESFIRISRFFTRTINPESPVLYGNSMTCGSSEIVASDFLLRYYSIGGTLIHGEHYPMLMEETAAAAMKNYIDMLNNAEVLPSSSWDESINSFAEGRTAMMILFMNHFYKMTHYRSLSSQIGFAPTPGNKPLLGGGVLGVSKHCNKTEEVTRFFQWVYSDEISEQIALLGGISAKDAIYHNQTILDLYPWLTIAQNSSSNGVRETSLPTGQAYNYRNVEKIIGRGIKNVINRIMTVDEAVRYINQSLAGIR